LTESANEIKALVISSSLTGVIDADSDPLDDPEAEVLTTNLVITATNRQAIDTRVFAGSVAASVGGSFGGSLSGAGGAAFNRINTDTLAALRDTTQEMDDNGTPTDKTDDVPTVTGVEIDGDVTITAADYASITSSVMAVSVAAAFGTFGGSIAIGVSIADNLIAGSVRAQIDRATIDTLGFVSVEAFDKPSIESYSTAVAVAITGAIGVAFAGGGAVSYNTIETAVLAVIDRSGETPVESSSPFGWSEVVADAGISIWAANEVDLYNEVFAAAAAFGLIAAAGAGTVTENTILSLVDASISGTEVITEGTVEIIARADQGSWAESHALAVSTGASVGVASVTTIDRGIIRAGLGDDVQIEAGTLRIDGYAIDNVYQFASASSGGLFVGVAGADSTLGLEGVALATVGNRNRVQANTVQITSGRDNNFDARSENLAIGGLVSGSGAAMTNVVRGISRVAIGENSSIDAETVVIRAKNAADKTRLSATQDSLDSTSAGLGSVSDLAITTRVGSGPARFGAVVDIGEGSEITVQSDTASGGTLSISTYTNVDIIDKVRVDGYGGYALNIARAQQSADLISGINLSGATLRNFSGDVLVATRTDADLTAAANVGSGGAIAGADGRAFSALSSDNTITVSNSELLGTDVKLRSGQDANRVTNLLMNTARADMKLVALYGLSIPTVKATLAEFNAVRLVGDTAVRAVRDVEILAEPGIGGDERARHRGMYLNLSVPPFGGDLEGKGTVTSRNQVEVSPEARLEAGVNYRTQMLVRPILVNGKLDNPYPEGVAGAPAFTQDRLGQDLTEAEKNAFGLDPAQRYEFARIEMDEVAIGVSRGTVVEAVPGAFGKALPGKRYYEYTPASGANTDSNLVLDQQDYTNARLWTPIEPTHQMTTSVNSYLVKQGEIVRTTAGQWYKRTGTDITITRAERFSSGWSDINSISSDKGISLAMTLADDFYVVKPKDVPLPQLVYANVANALFEDRAKIVDWIQSHSGNAEMVARYQVLLEQIDAKLKKLGLAETANGVTAARASFDQLFLKLPPLQASGGGIYVYADDGSKNALNQAVSSGRAVAHGSANITITNASPFGLVVNELGILPSGRTDRIGKELVTMAAGSTWFKGSRVGDAGSASGESVIRVTQDAYPKEWYNVGGTFKLPDAPQDLYVRGRISNASGALFLTNMEGSINVTGELRAASVKLTALGDFNLATDDWYHSGADPQQYLSWFEAYGKPLNNEAGARRVGKIVLTDTERSKLILDAIAANAARASVVFAMGEININARYLNVNGLIQSGVDSIDLTFTPQFNPSRTSNFTDSQGALLPGIEFGGPNKLQSVDGAFDAEQGLILLDDIKPAAGVINLTGQVVSTGNGRIRVASGYAAVNIVNQTRYRLAVGSIDVSENRVGRITITDTDTLRREVFTVAGGKMDRALYQGTLEQLAGGVSSITYTKQSEQTGLQADSSAADYLPILYQPEAGRYYVWAAGQAKTRTTVKIYEQKSFNLIGWDWDWLAPDAEAKSTDTKFTDGTPLSEAELLIEAAEVTNDLIDGDELFVAVYLQKSNPAVSLTKGVSLVRDVTTNKLYRWAGATGNVSFPVLDFTDAAKWTEVAQLSGGQQVRDIEKVALYPGKPELHTPWESTESNKIKYLGQDWKPAKADSRFDSDFNNQEIIEDPPITTGGGWLREKTVTTKTTTTTGLKDFYTYGLKADRPIAIEAMLGSKKQTINIQTPGRLELRSSITYGNAVGTDDYDSFKPIALSSNALEVSGTAVFSGAVPDIKANDDITIRIKDPRGKLNVVATGDITIEQIDNKNRNLPIRIGQIIAASYEYNGRPLKAGEMLDKFDMLTVAEAHEVRVLSTDGILGIGATSRIIGGTIQLDGGSGLVAARIDSAIAGDGGVAARALGSINLVETNGDLNLIEPTAWDDATASIEAGGMVPDAKGKLVYTPQDITLEVTRGALLDAAVERNVISEEQIAELSESVRPSDTEGIERTFGSADRMADLARYPLAADVLALLYPHMNVQVPDTPNTELVNLRGRNIVVSASDGLAGPPAGSVTEVAGTLIGKWDPTGARDATIAVPGTVALPFMPSAGAPVVLGPLVQSGSNLGLQVEPGAALSGTNRLPAFSRVYSDAIDREAYLSITLAPQAGKAVRIDKVTVSTEQAAAFTGARHAALATSVDGFKTLYEIDLQPGMTAETWTFQIGRRVEIDGAELQLDGGLQITASTEFRIYAWGMASQPLDADITSLGASPGGESPSGQDVSRVNDGDVDTVYRNSAGAGSGFQVSYASARVINRLHLIAANDRPGWDPVDYEIYGSTDPQPDWEYGTWALLGDGPTGLAGVPGSSSTIDFDNPTAYAHYKVVFPTTRGAEIVEGVELRELQLADAQLLNATTGTAGITVRSMSEAITSSAAAGTGVQVFGAVYEAPVLLASFEPGTGASGEVALEAIRHQAGFEVGALAQSAPVAAQAD
ncbi:MAG: hypothetical protein ACKO8O_21270, partial [Betaproteobacteria bacterium]